MARPLPRDDDTLRTVLTRLTKQVEALINRTVFTVGKRWRIQEDSATGDLIAVVPSTRERVVLGTLAGAAPTPCEQVVACVNAAIDTGDIEVGGGGVGIEIGTVTQVEPLRAVLADGSIISPGSLSGSVYTVGDKVWLIGSESTWLVLGHPRGAQLTFANQTAVQIPDDPGSGQGGAAVSSSITVTDIVGSAPATLRVGVDITHAFAADLVVTLFSPTSVAYIVHNHAEGVTSGIHTEFVVNAAASPASGTWTLRVQDFGGGDVGTLNSWYLTFPG